MIFRISTIYMVYFGCDVPGTNSKLFFLTSVIIPNSISSGDSHHPSQHPHLCHIHLLLFALLQRCRFKPVCRCRSDRCCINFALYSHWHPPITYHTRNPPPVIPATLDPEVHFVSHLPSSHLLSNYSHLPGTN